MPEIIPGGRETYPDKPSLTLLADGSHETFDGFRSHFIKNANHLAGQQGRVHYDEGAVGAHELRKSFQIDGFALRHLAANLQWNLERNSDCATTLRVSGPMHEPALEGDLGIKACHG